MTTSIKTFTTIAIIALTAFPVLAEEVLYPGSDAFTEYKKSGPWTIFADSERKSCLIEHVDADGTAIQMGLTSDRALGYVGVFTDKDVGMPDVKDADITIEINGHIYAGRSHEMKRKLSDAYKGGYFLVNNPEFVSDLENGTSMTVVGDKTGAGVKISLDGTKAAIEEAIACSQAM